MNELDVQLMRDIQYRKELSIPYFNSLNNSVAIVLASVPKTATLEKKMELIKQVKQQLLDEYKQYRVDIMDTYTQPLVEPKLQAGLDKAKTNYELRTSQTT